MLASAGQRCLCISVMLVRISRAAWQSSITRSLAAKAVYKSFKLPPILVHVWILRAPLYRTGRHLHSDSDNKTHHTDCFYKQHGNHKLTCTEISAGECEWH